LNIILRERTANPENARIVERKNQQQEGGTEDFKIVRYRT